MVADGLTELEPDAAFTLPIPLSIVADVAPVIVQLSIDEFPGRMLVGVALKLIVGRGRDARSDVLPNVSTAKVLAAVSVTFTLFRVSVPQPRLSTVNVTVASKPLPEGPALVTKLKPPKVTLPAVLSMTGPTPDAVLPVLPRNAPSTTLELSAT